MTAQTTDLAPRLIWQLGAELGEGPLWLPEQQRLYFVNLKGSTLHALDADGSQHGWKLPTFICWIVPRRDGETERTVGPEDEDRRVRPGEKRPAGTMP